MVKTWEQWCHDTCSQVGSHQESNIPQSPQSHAYSHFSSKEAGFLLLCRVVNEYHICACARPSDDSEGSHNMNMEFGIPLTLMLSTSLILTHCRARWFSSHLLSWHRLIQSLPSSMHSIMGPCLTSLMSRVVPCVIQHIDTSILLFSFCSHALPCHLLLCAPNWSHAQCTDPIKASPPIGTYTNHVLPNDMNALLHTYCTLALEKPGLIQLCTSLLNVCD